MEIGLFSNLMSGRNGYQLGQTMSKQITPHKWPYKCSTIVNYNTSVVLGITNFPVITTL